MSELPAAVCLAGPTAAGKTALALALCEHYPFEIISVDSALVYRGMDIGTAKPSAAERAQVPHHLIDIRDPGEPYSAAEFRRDALALMAQISARGRIPLLVGGTLLYYQVLCEGIAALPAADPQVRAELAADAERDGWPALHRRLAAVDPVAAARIHPHHSQRIQRALEVHRLTGRPLSELQREGAVAPPPTHRLVALAIAPAERAELHRRIAWRFAAMLEAGFLDEVAALRGRGDLHLDLPSMRAVGYRQAWTYLDGAIDRAALLEQGIAATRQLAKRQFTWLRRWPGLQWLRTGADQRLAEPGPLPAGADAVAAALKYLRETPI